MRFTPDPRHSFLPYPANPRRKNNLPNFTKQFAADAGPARRASAHHAFRCRQNADAQAADDRPDLRCAEIKPCARPRNALEPGDDAAPVGRVLEEHAQSFARLVLVHELEGGDVASSFRMRAISVFSFDEGTSTRWCL